MNTIRLDGCAPVPLAFYLKALGVLRLVAEQADPAAKGFWEGDAFLLRCTLDNESLVSFFLADYRPSPVVAPWNGGSGFNPKDNQAAIGAIRNGRAARLEGYRNTVQVASDVLRGLSISEKVSKEAKTSLLESCRNRFSDGAVNWLDAAFVLTEEGPQYPPLLGTGGNDGRLDFTNNFMQRLVDVLNADTGAPTESSEKWLRSALFNQTTDQLGRGSIGQFYPSAAGGANSSSGFGADSILNPWDFILMIEGAMVFAAASAKRMGSKANRNLSAPFCVRQTGVGYASASVADESGSRAEMWLPLWPAPAGFSELAALMSEGRAQVSGRPVRNGVDFTRAIATLGVDRGISSFQRYGFQVRNGLAYFATPLDRLPVRRNLQADLIGSIDRWLDDFRGRASAENAPASAARSNNALEAAVFALCNHGGPARVQDVLASLGACEHAMARSMKWTAASFLKPVPPLSSRWLRDADDGSVEFRLAAALASVFGRYGNDVISFRQHLEPVKTWVKQGNLGVAWDEHASGNVVWHEGDLVSALNEVMSRRLLMAVQGGARGWPDGGRLKASLPQIAALVEGRMDERRFSGLLRGLCLLDWPAVDFSFLGDSEEQMPGAGFALMKLCFAGAAVRGVSEVSLVPEIHQRAASGDGAAATQLASRRLRGSGLPVAVDQVHQSGDPAKRAAAALLFPLSHNDVQRLARIVLRPEAPTN
jgi:CRISPR-associated protein Csx17